MRNTKRKSVGVYPMENWRFFAVQIIRDSFWPQSTIYYTYLKSISPTFCAQLFCTKVLCTTFLYLQFRFALFWRKNISALKASLKMLVKLIPRVNFFVPISLRPKKLNLNFSTKLLNFTKPLEQGTKKQAQKMLFHVMNRIVYNSVSVRN